MSRTIGALLLCLGLPALAACQTPTWQQAPTKNKPRQHVMVQFTDSSVHPAIAQVLPGGTVSWVNYGEELQGSIVFAGETAESIGCKEARGDWMKTDSGYQSIAITTGGVMNDLDLPCKLKPGEYDYEIWLFEAPPSDPAAMADPQARMPGKIIVQ